MFGEHDGSFWELCRRIEREVERDDWKGGGGRSLAGAVYYEPEVGGSGSRGGVEDLQVVDHGGWSGGEYVLGRGDAAAGGSASESASVRADANAGLSRRQILAQAAEERMKKASRVQRLSANGNLSNSSSTVNNNSNSTNSNSTNSNSTNSNSSTKKL